MPEKDELDPSDDSASQATPEPRWKPIDNIANKMEKIFFEESTKEQLSPYEMSVIINRVNLLFEEYRGMVLSEHLHGDKPNVEFKGSTHLYK